MWPELYSTRCLFSQTLGEGRGRWGYFGEGGRGWSRGIFFFRIRLHLGSISVREEWVSSCAENDSHRGLFPLKGNSVLLSLGETLDYSPCFYLPDSLPFFFIKFGLVKGVRLAVPSDPLNEKQINFRRAWKCKALCNHSSWVRPSPFLCYCSWFPLIHSVTLRLARPSNSAGHLALFFPILAWNWLQMNWPLGLHR